MTATINEKNQIEVADAPQEDSANQQLVDYTPFNQNLDAILDPNNFLTPKNRDIVYNGLGYLGWVGVFRNSPANNSEAEAIMGAVVTAAVRSNGWVNIPRIEGESTPVFINFSQGEQILIDMGWLEAVIDDEGNTVLRPLAPMIEFIRERMKQYGPMEGTSP